ncbi:MAG: IS200/IS605 family element transposase accessory protein TnpB [Candidatus Aenigmarchaeota archaeon]|nr:IS200/IS605 family element transposase accessory protein TnpB [Candidatus Aenigmarchaeota archaeon]
MQRVQKIIKCKITDLTNVKEAQLSSEFKNVQTLLQLEKEGLDFLPLYKNLQLHSANRQQALRFYKRIDANKDYPVSVRKDLIKIEEKNNKLAKYWCRIPVRGRRGGLWVAIKPHQDFPEKFEFGESKVFRKKNHKGRWNWWIYITVVRQVQIKESYSNILAIDLGSKVTATVCGSFDNRPIFLGREVRGIRRHYQYLRTQLGRKKLLKKIRQMSDKEQRRVNDILHKISKHVVETAEHTDSYIVLGDLKGIRNSTGEKGRMFRRIVSNMPYLRLTQYVEYKAREKGIKVVRISERNSSVTCSRCGCADRGNRKSQGLFRCRSCGFEINADVNGVRNILKFSGGYMLPERAASDPAPERAFSAQPELPCLRR